MEDIQYKFRDYLKGEKTKIGERVLKWYNNNTMGRIVLDNDIYYIENEKDMPKYVINYIKSWCKKLGYIHIDNVKNDDF
jgi:hypothetical protein